MTSATIPAPSTQRGAPALPGATPDYPVSRRGIRTIPLRGGRWRVTREAGEVLGYVELVPGDAPRWRSSRMPARQARFVQLGEFGTPDDALDVIRLG
jgi:hypothetical protein